MKTNQLEVMRLARERAIKYQKINFTTVHVATKDKKKNAGSITVAFKKMDPFPLDFIYWGPGARRFRIQFSFCSPKEKNLSRIFGEGQAALRWTNNKSALTMIVLEGDSFMNEIHKSILEYANQRGVPWMENVTMKDLV